MYFHCLKQEVFVMGLSVILTLWSSPCTTSQLIKLSRWFSPMVNWFLKSSFLKIIFGIIDHRFLFPHIHECVDPLLNSSLLKVESAWRKQFNKRVLLKNIHLFTGKKVKKEKKGRDKNTLHWDNKKDVLKVLQELLRPYPLQASVWKCKDFFLLEERTAKTSSFLGFTGMLFHQNSVHCTQPLSHIEVTPTVVQVQAGGGTYHCPGSADSAGMWSAV